MSDSNIAFIGGGNMARSLIGGLVAAGTPSRTISVSEPQAELRNNLQEDFGINVHADNISAATGARVIVLAVKPQVLQEVVVPLGRFGCRTSSAARVCCGRHNCPEHRTMGWRPARTCPGDAQYTSFSGRRYLGALCQ